MQLVNEAFRVLNSPRERAKYDLTRDTLATHVDEEGPRRSHEARRPEPECYPPPTFRPYGATKPPYDQVPKSRLREGVIAATAAVVLLGGLGLATYNLIAPSIAKPAASVAAPVAADTQPVTVVHEAEPVRVATPSPKRAVAATVEAPLRYTHPRPVHHARITRRQLTPAQKDARAASIAARIEMAKRAAHPADDLYRFR